MSGAADRWNVGALADSVANRVGGHRATAAAHTRKSSDADTSGSICERVLGVAPEDGARSPASSLRALRSPSLLAHGEVGDPARDVGVLIQAVTGADAMVTVGHSERDR